MRFWKHKMKHEAPSLVWQAVLKRFLCAQRPSPGMTLVRRPSGGLCCCMVAR